MTSAGANELRSYAFQAAWAIAPHDLTTHEVLGISDAVLDALHRRGVPITDDDVSTEIVVEEMARVLLRNHLRERGHEPSADAWEDNPSAQSIWRDQARASLAALREVLLRE